MTRRLVLALSKVAIIGLELGLNAPLKRCSETYRRDEFTRPRVAAARSRKWFGSGFSFCSLRKGKRLSGDLACVLRRGGWHQSRWTDDRVYFSHLPHWGHLLFPAFFLALHCFSVNPFCILHFFASHAAADAEE